MIPELWPKNYTVLLHILFYYILLALPLKYDFNQYA